MAVPERLRARVGKREIKLSLETADPQEAKIRQAREQARWRSYFKAREAEIERDAVAQAPAIVDAFLEEMGRRNGVLANVIFGFQTTIAMRLFIAWGRDEFSQRRADRAFAFMPGQKAWRGADFSDLANIIPDTERDALLARIDLLHRHPATQGAGFAEALAWLLKAKKWDVVRIEVMLIEDHAGFDIRPGTALFDAVAEHLLRRLVEYSHPDSEALVDLLAPPTAPVSAPLPPMMPSGRTTGSQGGGKGSRPLSEGFSHWARLRAPRPQSELEAKRAVDRFIALNGDLAVGAITRDHLLDYRDFISRMPTNLNFEKLKASRLGFRGTVEKAIEQAGDGAKTLSPGAIKKDMGALGAVLTLLRNEGWIPDNVSAGIAVPGYSKTRRAQRTQRPWMMEKLFASPLFTGCEGHADILRTRPGSHLYQDELYWSFLFGATAGPRLEEVGQIRLDDIEVVPQPSGPPLTAIYVTGTGEGESIKNDESARIIIVHRRLLEVGFLDYVERRRAAGAERLFDLTQSATGKWTKELSRRVNRYVDRVVTDDPRYVFHSLRHEFKDRAEWTISSRVHDRITGHSPRNVGGRYGLGASIELMSRELEKLDLSFVDWDRLKAAAAKGVKEQ